MNARPHPGPLPQERENHSPRSGDADAPGYRASFSTNDEAAAMTRRLSKLSRNADSPTLSSGERASQITNFISSAVRVRASVKSILCLLCLLPFASPLLADDEITNAMSPVVSFQY